MKNISEILIDDICVKESKLILSYKGEVNFYSWLENYNKHYPDVFNLNVDYCEHKIELRYSTIYGFLLSSKGHRVKLSMSNSYSRVSYRISNNTNNTFWNNILIEFSQNSIVMSVCNASKNSKYSDEYLEGLIQDNKKYLYGISGFPISTLCIGSCFSRSIFKSTPYFNPNYKKYFSIKSTLFHNSFISLFSEKILFDYSSIEDLMMGDAGKYVGI